MDKECNCYGCATMRYSCIDEPKTIADKMSDTLDKADSIAENIKDIQSGRAIVAPTGKIVGYRWKKGEKK